eukprot:CAMPEP_0183381222 /NCGR_PEP_ID=MMETSP0164_2-20130417/126330_1 /TAXON_ID=221442 /ORGANISM="Coccolithus pelagicus ssp braarudi, Strain PLY182g" /LENGTH=119 /DNA_ID=CAMNT_0025558829 /DNA_START=831 /DNA_END=1190 /DNA_ORIENTATION=-
MPAKFHRNSLATKRDTDDGSAHVTKHKEEDGCHRNRRRRQGDAHCASEGKVASARSLRLLVLPQDSRHWPVACHYVEIQSRGVCSPSNYGDDNAETDAEIGAKAHAEEELVGQRHEQSA